MNSRIDPKGLVLDLRAGEAMRLTFRRRLVLLLNLLTLGAVAAAAGYGASLAGYSVPSLVLAFCVVAITPWSAIGFWNSLIGLFLLHARPGGVAQAAPMLAAGAAEVPLTLRTAIVMTVRNEDPDRAIARLRAVKAELDLTPHAALFDYFVLSDTSRADVAAAEAAAVLDWRRETGAHGIFYRRRELNVGYKAGNIREFCATHGDAYSLMLPLDADSLMGAASIVSMARTMQANPRIGILQSLVVGLPSVSAFARIFQFGMRAGMRCYTLGAAWWTGDCGPFWGHNAMVRIAPFRTYCHLPDLPGPPPLGGPILSHDQVEAVLMRRAGYEVRVIPLECESYEENPPALPDFLSRDARWCLGNMQYLKLVTRPGLHGMGRFQLIWAILMFLTVPAVPLALVALPFAAAGAPAEAGPLAAWLYGGLLLLGLFPKIAGYVDVALTPGSARRYGGVAVFCASALLELAFSFLLSAISGFSTCAVLLRLALGRRPGAADWGGQARDAHAISWGQAARALIWPTVFGSTIALGLAVTAPVLLIWTAPLLAGFWFAIPFAVASADPRLGAALARRGLCAIPEEHMPPAILLRLKTDTKKATRARVA